MNGDVHLLCYLLLFLSLEPAHFPNFPLLRRKAGHSFIKFAMVTASIHLPVLQYDQPLRLIAAHEE